jgi:uncharacterized protein (DUF433 family)
LKIIYSFDAFTPYNDGPRRNVTVTATAWPFIDLDEHGVAYVRGSTTRVIEIALEQTEGQRSAVQIQAAFPTFSLAQIHAALGYYFDHQTECDRLIANRQQRAEDLLDGLGNRALQERLHRLKAGA